MLDEIAAFASEGFENVVVSLRPSFEPSFPRRRESMGERDLPGQLLPCGWTSEALGLIDVLYPNANPFPALRNISAKSVGMLACQLGAGTAHPHELIRLLYTGKRILESVPLLRSLGIVHCHAHFAHYPAELAWGCSRLLGTTFSWNAHSYDLYLYSAHLRRRIKDADLIFPISEANRRFIAEYAGEGPGVIEEKIHVHRCGIRLEEYSMDGYEAFPPTPTLPPKGGGGVNPPLGGRVGVGGVNDTSPILFGVGRLVDTKGFADLVRAASLLLKSGTQVKVRIIGEGPERENLLNLARSLGCGNQLELLGSLPRHQVREEQRNATLLVMPCCPGKNGLDGIPVVLMEAMALGTPVVATRFAAIPELVEEGITGRLVPPQAPGALANVIRELVENPSQREQLAQAARRKIEKEYNGPHNYRAKARLVKELITTRFTCN